MTVPSGPAAATQPDGVLVVSFTLPDTAAVAPSATEVAAAVRSALALELARLDVAVSSRATPDDIPAGGNAASRYGGVLR